MTRSTGKPIHFGEKGGMTRKPDVFLSTKALERDMHTDWNLNPLDVAY